MKARNKRWLLVAALLLMLAVLFAFLGCAPKENTPSGGGGNPGGGSGVQLGVWSINDDCTTCHAFEVASATDEETVYCPHVTWEALTCIDCHTDADGTLTKAHANFADASDPTSLHFSKVGSSACLSEECHSTEKLAEATAASIVLTDKNGLVVNPHNLPKNTSHADINCASCHKLHKPATETDHDAQTLCVGCHHEDVYECNTCH